MKYKELLKTTEELESYEKSDFIIDIFKTLDNFDQIDIIQYITQKIL